MIASKRAAKELEELQRNLPNYLRDLCTEGSSVLTWNGLLLPDLEPYNLKAFKFRVTFPPDYPFSPPRLNFITQIYHPNVSESGEVCLPILNINNWNLHSKMCQVLEELNSLVNRPNEHLPVRAELANLYNENEEQFMENARKFTLKVGEDRPSSQ